MNQITHLIKTFTLWEFVKAHSVVIFQNKRAFRLMMYRILLATLTFVMAQISHASADEHSPLPTMRCETHHSDGNKVNIERDFYIVFNDINVIVKGDRIFFGGAKFYFLDGYVTTSQFRTKSYNYRIDRYRREDFELRNTLFVKEGVYFLSTSNLEANKPLATFDIHIRPTGLALPRIEDWRGGCVQISASGETVLNKLRAEKEAQK